MSTNSNQHISHLRLMLTIAGYCLASCLLFGFMQFQNDSQGYINAVELLLNQSEANDRLQRLNKPLALLFPALLYQLSPISIAAALKIQQIIAYCVSALFIFKSFNIVFQDQHKAYKAMMAYLLCQPLAVYGLAILTDAVGWCSAIVCIYFVLRRHHRQSYTLTNTAWIAAAIGLGFFVKESVAVAGVLMVYCILFSTFNAQNKIKHLSVAAISFLGIVVLGNLILFYYTDKQLLDWWLFAHSDPPSIAIGTYIKQAYHCFDVFWLLVVFGAWRYWQKERLVYDNIFAASTLSCLLLLPLIWPYFNDRILFLTAPLLLYWIVRGSYILGVYSLYYIAFAGMSNLVITYAIYRFQWSGLIATQALLFGLLLGIAYIFANKNPDIKQSSPTEL